MKRAIPTLAGLLLAAWFTTVAGAADAPAPTAGVDGPYVLERDGQRQQLALRRNLAGGIDVLRRPVRHDTVRSEVDEKAARHVQVRLRADHPRAAVQAPMPSRLLVASDFEGNFDAFATLLQGNRVLDRKLHWSFGDGHLVLLGDLVDRGDNVLPLLWLVYRLEAEAEAAGGRVHYVLGNHEQMLLGGDTRYLHPKYLATMQLTGESHDALWNTQSELGRWLRSKPVALKLGDWLFVHGGISPALLALQPTLEEIDAAASTSLASPIDTIADARVRTLLRDSGGVLWDRSLAMAREGTPRADAAHVTAALQHFGVRRIAIGHSLVQHVGSDYDGAVVRVDVPHARDTIEGLLVVDGQPYRVDALGLRSELQPAVNLD